MTRVSEKMWNSVIPLLRQKARAGKIDSDILQYPPTHVIDVYKMRRGRYKNVRIWIYLHLGTGERKDLFITNADNQPLDEIVTLYSTANEWPLDNWMEQL